MGKHKLWLRGKWCFWPINITRRARPISLKFNLEKPEIQTLENPSLRPYFLIFTTSGEMWRQRPPAENHQKPVKIQDAALSTRLKFDNEEVSHESDFQNYVSKQAAKTRGLQRQLRVQDPLHPANEEGRVTQWLRPRRSLADHWPIRVHAAK